MQFIKCKVHDVKGARCQGSNRTLAIQTAGELRHHTSWWQRGQMTQHPTWPVEAEGKWDMDTRSPRESSLAVGCRDTAVQACKNKTKSTELNWEGIRIRSPNNQKMQEFLFFVFVNFYFKYERNWSVRSQLWLITSGDRIELLKEWTTDRWPQLTSQQSWIGQEWQVKPLQFRPYLLW